jgi:uncharacterized protein YndB with AHSA1/START domain
MSAVETQPAAGPEGEQGDFVDSRDVDAPRELVWRAWTEPERLKRWWGPKGFTVRAAKVDLRPGGLFHYCLVSPDGQEMWGKLVYREIVAPERLEVIVSFSDEGGGVTRHPWSPDWPLETLSTMTFAERNGRTTVTVRWRPHNATQEERRTFDAGHDSMRQGWSGTFDQLIDYLAEEAGKAEEAPCMNVEPQAEHEWLQRLVGEWTYEGEAVMPEGARAKFEGAETVRSLGGIWIVAEGGGEMPTGGPAATMMTLGYDPQKGRFVGTFVASMMTFLWVYDGALDASGRVLTLDAEGPRMTPEGGMAKYQDIITVESDDRRTLTSRMLGDDGQWHEIMTARYRRKT